MITEHTPRVVAVVGNVHPRRFGDRYMTAPDIADVLGQLANITARPYYGDRRGVGVSDLETIAQNGAPDALLVDVSALTKGALGTIAEFHRVRPKAEFRVATLMTTAPLVPVFGYISGRIPWRDPAEVYPFSFVAKSLNDITTAFVARVLDSTFYLDNLSRPTQE